MKDAIAYSGILKLEEGDEDLRVAGPLSPKVAAP
jgi:hypothetical protein